MLVAFSGGGPWEGGQEGLWEAANVPVADLHGTKV